MNRREFIATTAALLAGASFGRAEEPEAIAIPKPGPERDAWILDLARRDHVTLLKACQQLCRQVLQDYAGTVSTQESIDGKLLPERTAAFKFRQAPFSVVLEYLSGAPEVMPTIFTRKLVYVEGENGGKMQVFVRVQVNGEPVVDRPRPFSYDPHDPIVLQNSKKPITDFGFLRGLEASIALYEAAKKRGDLKEQTLHATTTVDGRPCVTLKRVVPQRVGPDGRKVYIASTTFTTIDIGRLLPVEVVGYDQDGALEFSYKMKLKSYNQGLQLEDFMPRKK